MPVWGQACELAGRPLARFVPASREERRLKRRRQAQRPGHTWTSPAGSCSISPAGSPPAGSAPPSSISGAAPGVLVAAGRAEGLDIRGADIFYGGSHARAAGRVLRAAGRRDPTDLERPHSVSRRFVPPGGEQPGDGARRRSRRGPRRNSPRPDSRRDPSQHLPLAGCLEGGPHRNTLLSLVSKRLPLALSLYLGLALARAGILEGAGRQPPPVGLRQARLDRRLRPLPPAARDIPRVSGGISRMSCGNPNTSGSACATGSGARRSPACSICLSRRPPPAPFFASSPSW